MMRGILYLVFALSFIGIGLICIYVRRKFFKCKRHTIAKVIEVSNFIDQDSGISYYAPRYQFEVNGRLYEGNGFCKTEDIEEYEVGDVEDIYYDDHNPSFFVAKEYVPAFGTEIFAFIAGCFALVLGILEFVLK